MDSNLYISALQRQPCLLKTNSTRVLVTWLVTLLLIICPSSYKARLNNLIGTADIEPQIISPQWSNARPNFPTKKCVGGAKFGLVSRLAHRHMATLKFKTKAGTRLDKHAVNRERKNKEVILFGNPTTFYSLKQTNVIK